MTKESEYKFLISLIREIEWGGLDEYVRTMIPCCLHCGGIKPDHPCASGFVQEARGHGTHCPIKIVLEDKV